MMENSFLVKLFASTVLIIVLQIVYGINANDGNADRTFLPIIINTWDFKSANDEGWKSLVKGSALDAVESACARCEQLQCDHTVGWGGSPDENGETTLDAMIMDGPSHKVGAVAALRNVSNAIGVARRILEHTSHTMLVGSQATQFALDMGFKKSDLTSDYSSTQFKDWKTRKCQPNYWLNVSPDPKMGCGPYEPRTLFGNNKRHDDERNHYQIDETNHDTIGVVAIDSNGHIASGTSTNGMKHKIPGRVGDSPIAGAGSYVDQDVGGAAATGDGDIIMRFLSSYQAVENMRNGMHPQQAAEQALKRILKKYPDAQVGIVAVDMKANYGAACINIQDGFPFVVHRNGEQRESKRIPCVESVDDEEQDPENAHNFADFGNVLPTMFCMLMIHLLLNVE